jgi:hypothetical protein
MEPKRRLGELLRDAGVIDETQLQSALGHQRRWGMKLGQALLDLKLATEPQIVTALSRKYGYEVAQIEGLRSGPVLAEAMKLVPKEVALQHTLLPIASDTSSITVAMSDPTNIALVDEISFRTGRRVKIAIAGERELAAAIKKHYFAEEPPPGFEPIAFDDSEVPIETSGANDPFGALPEHLRERYVGAGAGSPGAPPPADPPAARAPQRAQPAPGPAAWTPMPGAGSSAPPLLVPAPAVPRQLSPREVALTDAIVQLTRDGAGAGLASARAVAALVRILARKGIVTEVEFLDELNRR